MQPKLLITSAFLILISGCSTPKSALDTTSSGNEQVPGNFDPNNGILLIEQYVDNDNSTVELSTTSSVQAASYMNYFMKKNRKNMVEYADQNYKYKHEFTSQNDIYGSNSKYSDKKTYQFALVTSLVKTVQSNSIDTHNGQMKSTHHQPVFKFYLYDRLNDKTYSALSKGSSLIMWAYKSAIKKLNEAK
jgi:hypothetical protein